MKTKVNTKSLVILGLMTALLSVLYLSDRW